MRPCPKLLLPVLISACDQTPAFFYPDHPIGLAAAALGDTAFTWQAQETDHFRVHFQADLISRDRIPLTAGNSAGNEHVTRRAVLRVTVRVPQPEPHPRPFPEPGDPGRRPDLPPRPEPQPDGIPEPDPEPRPKPTARKSIGPSVRLKIERRSSRSPWRTRQCAVASVLDPPLRSALQCPEGCRVGRSEH
jgi:hypothetical protein